MMRWARLLDGTRLGSGHSTVAAPGRSAFQKDYDRIVFSAAFRRLQRKTQVHPLPDNDNVHTRLTHSLEVACVARSLALAAAAKLAEAGKLPDTIAAEDLAAVTEAAALAHDIGNPPFGHAGEFAIRQWFADSAPARLDGLSTAQKADLLSFDGNAQGFRLLAGVQNGIHPGGMRLTHATLASFLKYPWSAAAAPADRAPKFGAFCAEMPALEAVADAVGLIKLAPGRWARHPLVYLVEAADDICYALIDIEDGIELGLLDFSAFEKLIVPLLPDPPPPAYERTAKVRRKISWLRGQVMSGLLTALSDAFVDQIDALLAGASEPSLFARCDPRYAELIAAAKQLSETQIFLNHRKVQLEIGAFASIEVLLSTFSDAALEMRRRGAARSYRAIRVRELIGADEFRPDNSLYDNYLVALDYIAGMTDNFATTLARQLSGRGQ